MTMAMTIIREQHLQPPTHPPEPLTVTGLERALLHVERSPVTPRRELPLDLAEQLREVRHGRLGPRGPVHVVW